ncbi:TetR family transcriptional regulator C-terminal domain-containing protein [Brevundimonas sp.]|uniref:TetR family transcriptional regulator C-terminal domain-containing protein n=1 Tax=Brevundimonas sp. TaxID=1871086 RepID=UPI003BAA4ED8
MARPSYRRIQPDVRRRELIEAAMRCLADKGAAGCSVRAICNEAGVSPGLLTHYFTGVDDLMAATYREVGERVAVTLAEAVEAAGEGARDRLRAYVVASFRPPVMDPVLLATWVAFWSLSRGDAGLRVVHQEIYALYRGDLEPLIRACLPTDARDADVRLMGVGLTALVDGLWLELCLDGGAFTAEEAGRVAERWLDDLLARPLVSD